jgi:hypothetical protein
MEQVYVSVTPLRYRTVGEMMGVSLINISMKSGVTIPIMLMGETTEA